MESIKNLLTHDELMTKINTDLPDWLISVHKEYRKDYPHLISNWKKICKLAKTKPQYILRVREIPHIRDENPNITIIDHCGELARRGYVVRRTNELAICKTTGKVIPSKEMHDYMLSSVTLKSKIPQVWSDSKVSDTVHTDKNVT